MGGNPNPDRIPDALWWLWTEFDQLEPSAMLGGIWAEKAGYHSYRSRLPASDYSTGRDVANDKLGSSSLAAAIDLTMSAAAMKKYTARLDKACRARDPRLFIDGQPIIREFIGTLNGSSVYCYVLTGGRALGVGADAGPDPGRDKTHLWHIHVSIIRKFLNSVQAMRQLLSVLAAESLEAWRNRTSTAKEDDMPLTPAELDAIEARAKAGTLAALNQTVPYQTSGPGKRLAAAGWGNLSLRGILEYVLEDAVEDREATAAALETFRAEVATALQQISADPETSVELSDAQVGELAEQLATRMPTVAEFAAAVNDDHAARMQG